MPASAALARASASISSVMSSPIARPAGPTRRALMSTSAPAPDPRSSTVSPSWRSATAVGTPQPNEASTAPSGTPSRPASSYRDAPNTPVSSAGPQPAAPPQQPSPAPADAVAAAAYRSRTVSRMSVESAIRISVRAERVGERGERGPVGRTRDRDPQAARAIVERQVEERAARPLDVDRLVEQRQVDVGVECHFHRVARAAELGDARAQALVALGLVAPTGWVEAAGRHIQLSHADSSSRASGTT